MAAPATTNSRTAKVRELNDLFRQNLVSGVNTSGQPVSGRLMITSGIAALAAADQLAVLAKVQSFSAFSADNDPYGEHDFGAFEHAGHKVFWKIDYYAPDLMHGSDDPADPSVTVRVLTVMLAEEY